ncbi:MAG: hypothetical protein ACREL1_06480 [bacterium]
MGKSTVLFTVCFAFLFTVGCHKKDQAQMNRALSKVQAGAQQGMAAMKGEVTDTQVDYRKSVQAKIDQISVSIASLKKKAEGADGQAQTGLRRQVKGLETRRDDLQKKLDGLKNSTTGAWRDMVTGINRSLRDLQLASDKAVSQFTKPRSKK